ncbi:hypothetical protein ACFL6I_26380 [candidate division KSB1 bacterium]
MSITKDVENYVLQNASIKDCLKNNLVNYSSLSRRIIKELELKKSDFDAVLIACRRLQRKLHVKASAEKKISEILSKSKLEIRTGIVVFIIEKDIYYDHLRQIEKEIKKESDIFNVIEAKNTITLITSDEFSAKIKALFKHKIMRENKNLVELVVRTSSAIEKTPGVLSYLYSLFGEYGINIFETMSTWTDTLFIIDEKDLEKAVRILKFK